MAKEKNIVHLYDNTEHISEIPEDSNSHYRKLEEIQKNYIKYFRHLSSCSISELIDKDDNMFLFLPNSFQECNDELKKQNLFSFLEKEDRINSISINTGNIVGFIGYKGIDIRIHSRFSSSKEIKDYFLYYMLEKVLSINLFSLFTSSSHDDSVFDFLLFLFPKFLKEAMSQGMFKQYVYFEYNNSNIRGVVDVNRHIRLNIPANGRIAYRTREFSCDNSVTQLIRHTIEYIRRKSFGITVLHNDSETEACVQQIIQATSTYQAQQRQYIININLRSISHPYYTKYTVLQNLCLRILQHEKFSYGYANENKIHGLLIDAAWLWEEYIAHVLSEQSGFKHYTRKNAFNLFRKEDGGDFQPIIPDYLDEDNSWVADAKYIPLNRKDYLDADRAGAVYYKTIMYMYRFNSNKGFLFYPIPQVENDKLENLECEYAIIDTNGILHKIGLVIPTINEGDDYLKFKDNMEEEERHFIEKITNKI